ncbi:MCP four helix bundle domain-containing protein [Salibacter halophilus]|uniref:Chemotaxis protein n=1 Tax=Salibacter halophilus TaxID=1803916 RepID=A0A6N6M766_9FLAO|nr:MCP four helix bundle domain-containing protein [Salibacter halophilus]KAB1065900.1 chemotaxis protein [Salibacter halophilus]
MTIFNKIKWILAILVVFVLIVATNLIDKRNFKSIRDSIVTIYEDRLIAKDIIYEVSTAVQKKEVALVTSDSAFYKSENESVNHSIDNQIKRYKNTKLTEQERKVFEDLKKNIQLLLDAEKSNAPDQRIQENIEDVKKNLSALSEIQLDEGKRQLMLSKRAMDSIELFTDIEIYILIALAILIQIIVVYQPKKRRQGDY